MAKTFTNEYRIVAIYQDLYSQKYNRPIQINRYKEKWAIQSLLEDFGFDTVEATLTYYFKTMKDGHPLSWFYSNFELLNNNRLSQINDDMIRAERRARTQKIVEEYKNGLS